MTALEEFLKGAPDADLDWCGSQMKQDGGTGEIDRSDWEKRSEDLADEGFRLLAVAMAERSSESDDFTFDDVEEGFTLLGFAAIMDLPRPEATDAVEECKGAGIRVKMITGDHARTAVAIARSMGIGTEKGSRPGPR